MRAFVFTVRVLGGALAAFVFIVGLGGFADDWTASGRFLQDLSGPQLRAILVAIAATIALMAVPWSRVLDRRPSQSESGMHQNVRSGASSQAMQGSPGSIQIGNLVVSSGPDSDTRARLRAAILKAENALDGAKSAMSLDGVSSCRSQFLLALAEIADIAEDSPGADVAASLASELGKVSPNALEFSDPDYLRRFERLKVSIRSLPNSESRPTNDRDAEEVRELRRKVGRINERLGDYGPPLADDEDHRIRGWLIECRDAAGTFAYETRLRQALRDFLQAAGWMLGFKSRHGVDGLKHFNSAEEASEARGQLHTASEELISACSAFLDPAPNSTSGESKPRPDLIEVTIESEGAFVSLCPCYTDPKLEAADATSLLAVLPSIRIRNHDGAATTIDQIWVTIQGSTHRGDVGPNEIDLRGNRRIEARSYEDFSLEVHQVFVGRIPQGEGWFRVFIMIKTLGLGTFRYALQKDLFDSERPGW